MAGYLPLEVLGFSDPEGFSATCICHFYFPLLLGTKFTFIENVFFFLSSGIQTKCGNLRMETSEERATLRILNT